MKTLTFVVAATLVAATLRVLIFGWPEQVYFDDRTSPDGDVEYTCMFESEEDWIEVTRQETHARLRVEGVHYHAYQED